MKKIIAFGVVAGIAAASAFAVCKVRKANRQVCNAVDDEQPPSFFQNLGWRDRKALVLGSTKVWEYLKPAVEDDGVYPLAFFECSQKAQYGILRCYFGHLAEEGTVLLAIDPSERIPKDNVSPIDAQVVHELVFRAEGGGLSEKQKKQPLVCFPCWSARFMKAKKAKEAGEFKGATWQLEPIPKGYAVDADFVNTVKEFCDSRNLKLRVLVLSARGDDIVNQLNAVHVDDVVFCPDAASLNEVVFGL